MGCANLDCRNFRLREFRQQRVVRPDSAQPFAASRTAAAADPVRVFSKYKFPHPQRQPLRTAVLPPSSSTVPAKDTTPLKSLPALADILHSPIYRSEFPSCPCLAPPLPSRSSPHPRFTPAPSPTT